MRSKYKILGLAALLGLMAVLLSGVIPAEGDQEPKQRYPEVPAENEQALLVEGNSAFAFELYQALRESEGNLFYSPHSISLALAMTYAGARGQTAEQMAATLQFLLEQERLHPAFNWLDVELAQRGEGAEGKDGEGFRLNIVNAIWGQKDYSFMPAFLDVLAENYGAGLRTLDFKRRRNHRALLSTSGSVTRRTVALRILSRRARSMN